MSPPRGESQDFDVGGAVAVRVVDAGDAAARRMAARLGGVPRAARGAPDLTVRFVDRLPTADMGYVEPGRSGFTPDGYLVLSDRRRAVVARMPFHAPGPPVEIVCERGASRVPLLDAWVRLVALHRGHVPLHASAFEYGGRGVLVAGGPHGGKTSCLLAFAGTGARFLSDDLVLLGPGGETLTGVGDDIAVSDWQLGQLPAPGGRLGPVRRALLAGARGLERLHPRLAGGRMGALTHAGPRALRRRAEVVLAPGSLFAVSGSRTVPTGAVFLAESHASPGIEVEAVAPDRLAERLAATLLLQLHPLVEHYLGYRFAFPGRRSAWIEDAGSRAEALLVDALAGRDTFLVRHPHPVSLADLGDAMRPLLDAPSGAGTRVAPSRESAAPTPALGSPRP